MEISGINFLSDSEMTVYVNKVGIFLFKLNYKFKLPTNPTVVVSISPDE